MVAGENLTEPVPVGMARRDHIIRREGQKGIKNNSQIPGLGHKEYEEWKEKRTKGRDPVPRNKWSWKSLRSGGKSEGDWKVGVGVMGMERILRARGQ